MSDKVEIERKTLVEITSGMNEIIDKSDRSDTITRTIFILWISLVLGGAVVDYGIQEGKVYGLPVIKDHMEKQVIKNKLYEEYLKNQNNN